MNESGKSKRRFIAGAVCPRCKEMDTIVVYREEGVDHRACVSCDFVDRANFTPAEQELTTRVHRPAEPAAPDPNLQVVRILDPSKKK
ncbi:YheV family putative metal-binding protein [Proteobacteria bacterium 005FR1]|nr:YheV family putative metal-binding protein [Proteobacteria bacterium 005FR1]